MPKRNIELLTKVRDLIRDTPQRLDMSTWAEVKDVIEFDNGDTAKVSCGTTACIAGWAVQLHGYKLLVTDVDKRTVFDDKTGTDKLSHYEVEQCVAQNGRAMDIERKAIDLLGLDEDEAGFLFYLEDHEALEALNGFIDGRSWEDIKFEMFGPEDDYDF